ncbi:DUF3027 domain-containing protein [Demequina sp. NBRC 110054]|uniref:DUF3027 domain-containing protein n=1 Tax=Demequina sp. NBRC 110054 TaxID=1570343 RepID=UPI000A070F61|nr:DUF3027 domain-containing protein [Demequina sp. NBRC 110054]
MAVDAVLESAVEAARDAAIEVAEDATAVGEHLSAHDEGDKLVTHLFACTLPGYRGWVWSVTLSRTPRLKTANVCEAHLVPADDALLAPAWIPWADRVQPGDIKPGMAVPRIDQDPRLMPGYTATDDEESDAVAIWELGLGRERVLAPAGRDEAAARWTERAQEVPTDPPSASAAAGAIGEFVIPLSGSMRLHFGVCANKWCPFDGTVVPVNHACGGGAQSAPERSSTQWPANDPVYVDESNDVFDLTPEPEPEPEVVADVEPEGAVDESSATDTEPTAETAEGESPAEAADVAAMDDAVATDDPAVQSVEGSTEDAAPEAEASEPEAAPEPAAEADAVTDAVAADEAVTDAPVEDAPAAEVTEEAEPVEETVAEVATDEVEPEVVADEAPADEVVVDGPADEDKTAE